MVLVYSLDSVSIYIRNGWENSEDIIKTDYSCMNGTNTHVSKVLVSKIIFDDNYHHISLRHS